MADRGTPPAGWRSAAFETLVDASIDGAWACDRDLRCLYWNPAMERFSALPAIRAVGYGIIDLLARVADGDAEPAIREVLAGAPTAFSEQRLVVTSSSGALLRTQLMPIRLETGEIVGVTAIVRDTTEAERIRQELRETDARFRNMADASPVLLWMSRPDGLCTFFNHTWLEFTGRTLDQEWGVGWAESVHFEDLEGCMETYTSAFNERRPLEVEYRLRRKDGEYRWLLDRATPRYTPNGHFAGYIGSCVDITDRRQLEAELRDAIEARDDFLAVASHELGTPLTALKLNVERLIRNADTESGKRARSRVGAIAAEVHRLGQLVDALLDTTRLRTGGGWRLRPEAIDLKELIETILRDLAPVAESAQCPVRFRTVPSLVGVWDRQRLEQALINVLSNAFKFGEGEPVDVTLNRDGATATLQITDHGVGLPAEEQELIFNRFGRAPHTRGYGGLGVGLWIARQSIEAMGGTICVESVVGEGATFEVVLNCQAMQIPTETRDSVDVASVR